MPAPEWLQLVVAFVFLVQHGLWMGVFAWLSFNDRKLLCSYRRWPEGYGGEKP